MQLISLNIGIPTVENFHGREIVTGLCKLPVHRSLFLTKTGFLGDGVQKKNAMAGRTTRRFARTMVATPPLGNGACGPGAFHLLAGIFSGPAEQLRHRLA
ncbi:hypothetical protein OLX77_06785 [Desulfobacterales bacterium RS19-109]|uniref:Uncharacterized protein n=1 Tax=Thiovibrio frasassiensis TaxID=2984131 RepID=A0A9X4MGA5_9BACT|nr:hypothetical protein [Thiovibrio frasassiensis]MDG4475863.1 hypothetical protein [Thiovibrio frasassiensis]